MLPNTQLNIILLLLPYSILNSGPSSHLVGLRRQCECGNVRISKSRFSVAPKNFGIPLPDLRKLYRTICSSSSSRRRHLQCEEERRSLLGRDAKKASDVRYCWFRQQSGTRDFIFRWAASQRCWTFSLTAFVVPPPAGRPATACIVWLDCNFVRLVRLSPL